MVMPEHDDFMKWMAQCRLDVAPGTTPSFLLCFVTEEQASRSQSTHMRFWRTQDFKSDEDLHDQIRLTVAGDADTRPAHTAYEVRAIEGDRRRNAKPFSSYVWEKS
jgi:hypothetical protein